MITYNIKLTINALDDTADEVANILAVHSEIVGWELSHIQIEIEKSEKEEE